MYCLVLRHAWGHSMLYKYMWKLLFNFNPGFQNHTLEHPFGRDVFQNWLNSCYGHHHKLVYRWSVFTNYHRYVSTVVIPFRHTFLNNGISEWNSVRNIGIEKGAKEDLFVPPNNRKLVGYLQCHIKHKIIWIQLLCLYVTPLVVKHICILF